MLVVPVHIMGVLVSVVMMPLMTSAMTVPMLAVIILI